MADAAWRAAAPGVLLRAEAAGGPAGGAGAGWGIADSREGDAPGRGSAAAVGSDWAPGRSRRSGADGIGPRRGGRGGLQRVGAVLGAVVVIVVLVRIAATAPNASIPTTTAAAAGAAAEPPAATHLPRASAPAAPMDPTSPGPADWMDSTASGSTGPTATASRPPAPAPPAEPTTEVGAESSAPTEDGPVDWWSVLAQLDLARASALAAREVAALDAYAVPDSPAWDQDAGLIGDLRARGLAPVGLTTHLVGIEQAPADADHGPGAVVELVIVDHRAAYSLVDDGGAVVEQVPASGLRRWRVRLAGIESTVGGLMWLLHAVEPMP